MVAQPVLFLIGYAVGFICVPAFSFGYLYPGPIELDEIAGSDRTRIVFQSGETKLLHYHAVVLVGWCVLLVPIAVTFVVYG